MRRSSITLAALAMLAFMELKTQPMPQSAEGAGATVGLVQVDAVVTDSKGAQATNLLAEDFAVEEDGKPQRVTSVSYAASRPTIVFVADNCDNLMGQGAIQPVLEHFLERQIGPDDLVSIMPLAEGASSEERLTADRALLARAIARFSDLERVHAAIEYNLNEMGNDGQPLFHGLASYEAAVSAVDGLAPLPGRKHPVFISHAIGWPPYKRGELVDQLGERASRADIEIDHLNPGLGGETLARLPAEGSGPGALVRATGGSSFLNKASSFNRAKWIAQSVDDLGNIVDKILGRARNSGSGYYLVTYDRASPLPASAGTAAPEIKVSVRRSGLTVHWRNGYYKPPEMAVPGAEGRASALETALRSPLAGGGLRLSMIPFISATDKDPKSGKRQPLVRATAAIDPRDLRFVGQPGGSKKATVELLAEADGGGNSSAVRDDIYARAHGPAKPARNSGSCSMTVPADEFAAIGSHTLLCSVTLTLPEAGPYMVRLAARDAASGAVGSAYALAPVPNYDRDHIWTSTVQLSRAPGEETAPALRSRDSGAAKPPAALNPAPFAGANPVERVFAPGDLTSYRCEIFGAKVDKQEGLPHIEVVVRLTRDGVRFFFQGPSEPLRPTSGARQLAIGRIRLPVDAGPGRYTMTLGALDVLAPKPDYGWPLNLDTPSLRHDWPVTNGSTESMGFWVAK